MGRGVRRHLGGIGGLLRLLREHGEAVEYDLITLGLRLDCLGSEALTWRDLLVIVRQSSGRRESALHRALNPAHQHTVEVEMLRAVEYRLHWLVWAKTEDGAKRRNPPEPIRFSWEPRPRNEYTGDTMTVAEWDEYLGWTPDMKGGA